MKLHDNPTLGVIAGGVALLALTACATVPASPVPEAAADGLEARAAERSATPATPETAAYPNDAGKLAKIAQTAERGRSTAPILINYFGGIDAANTGFLVKTILAEIANGESHFQINLNSNGGDPNYSIATYNLLKNLPIHITTYNVNQVESAAVYLYCLGNRRHAHPRSIFTIHSVKWSLTAYSPLKFWIYRKNQSPTSQYRRHFQSLHEHRPSRNRAAPLRRRRLVFRSAGSVTEGSG